MICFAVVWTTRALDAEFIYLFSTDLPLVPAKLISRIVCSLFASPTNRNNGEIIRLLIEYLIRGDPYYSFKKKFKIAITGYRFYVQFVVKVIMPIYLIFSIVQLFVGGLLGAFHRT